MENELKPKSAWIVVDLVNDFVNGVFGSDQARMILKKTLSVLDEVKNSVLLVFTQDSHIHNDPEFSIWGEHCIMGTGGSELCEGLDVYEGYKIRKRHYDAFYDTDLPGFLTASGIDKLYISGISTEICVQHTVSGAFMRYYDTTVVVDLCTSIDPGKHSSSIDFMKRVYGVRVIDSEEFVTEVSKWE